MSFIPFRYFTIYLVVFVSLIAGCASEPAEKSVRVTMEIRNLYDEQSWLEVNPLHYKYAPKTRWHLENGALITQTLQVVLPENTWMVFHTGGIDYELPMVYDGHIHLEADGGQSPALINIQVNGEPLRDYMRWLIDDMAIQDTLRALRPYFVGGNVDDYLKLQRKRKKLASSVFADSDLEHISHRVLGEYLVARLQSVDYRLGQPGFNANDEREQIHKDARRHNFFTIPVLEAQRAGSRDFTHFYANSFGIDDVVREQYGDQLSVADISRLGYDALNASRQSVADRINDPTVKAYVDMHLVAERLGDAPFDVAEPSYLKWMDDYGDEQSEWAAFLRTHYEGVKRVTPGQPAIGFSYTDNNDETHSLADYKGKYVLLDFWANWCAPCLEEFPDMNRIYAKYDRTDFEILGISIDLNRDYWLSRIPVHENAWPQLWAGKQFEEETFVAYRGGGIPFYILIDRDGKIIRYNDVRATYNLESVVDSLLARER